MLGWPAPCMLLQICSIVFATYASSRQATAPAAASSTVATPDEKRVKVAPSAPTIGPPRAVPSGVETMRTALRAASTAGKFFVAVADWYRAYVSGTNGP